MVSLAFSAMNTRISRPLLGKNYTKFWLISSTKQPLKIFGQREANLEHMHYSNQKLELNPISPRSEMLLPEPRWPALDCLTTN